MPIHIHDRARSTPLVCWAFAYPAQELVQADTGPPASYTFEALFQMSRPSVGQPDPGLRLGLGPAGMHAHSSSGIPVCRWSTSGPATEFPSVPPRGQDRLPGEPNSPQEPNYDAPLSLTPTSSKVPNQDTPQLQDTLCALNSQLSHSSSHCPAKSNSFLRTSALTAPASCSTFPKFPQGWITSAGFL